LAVYNPATGERIRLTGFTWFAWNVNFSSVTNFLT